MRNNPVPHRLGAAYSVLGVQVRLDLPDPLGGALLPALVDLEVGEAPPDAPVLAVRRRRDDTFDVRSEGQPDACGLDAGSALYEVLIRINHIGADSAAVDDTVLHAGVVELGGAAVALVGHSGAGKTTLTTGAALRQFGYVADEICAIDARGMVRPFHRPTGLRRGGAAALGISIPDDPLFESVYPFRIGERARLAGAVPLRLVALVERYDGPAEFVDISPAEALVRLANQTLGDIGVERAMFRRLERLVRTVPIVTFRYGAIDDAVRALRAHLEPLAERTAVD